MNTGPPTWLSTILVSGNARARSTRSPSWVWYIQASNDRSSGASAAKPSRQRASSSSPWGARADPKIDVADDAGAALGGAVLAAGAHRRDAGDELGLAQRAQLGLALGAVHLAAFEEHGGADVVAAADVGEQLGQQVVVVRA